MYRSAAVAATAVAAPCVIPAGVLAGPGRVGPNDRIRIGAIGVGRQGSRVVKETAACKDARIVAVADVHLPRAQEIAGQWKAEAYQDYRKLLDRKDVDAVVTATPDHWHALICIHVCQAGKDIYSEKPMSLTIREGRLMVQAARKYDCVYQSGSLRRSLAVNRLGCAMIRKGGIGRIKRVIAHNYPSPWLCALPAQPVPEGLDWDAWCGATEVVPYNQDLFAPRANPGWMSFRPYSGGEMTNWGAHGLDQVQWALGMDQSGPIAVWTEGEKFAPVTYTAPESVKRGDNACGHPKVFFQYPNDIVVELGAGPEGGAIFMGDKGTATIDHNLCKSDPPEMGDEVLKQSSDRRFERYDIIRDHIQNWLDCVRSREKPICDAEAGHRTITVCHLGNIARMVGRKLRWDPVKEVFPDDAEANQYLDRPRRKQYELPQTV
jgi:predicted dehydrogenase